MQTKSTLALTPALSPRRGRTFSPCWSRSPRGDLPKLRDCFSLSLGERAGVGASLGSNCIVTAKVRAPAEVMKRILIFQILLFCGLLDLALGIQPPTGLVSVAGDL